MRINRNLFAIILACIPFTTSVQGEDLPHAANIFPKETQGYVRIEHLPNFLEHWNQTQLGILSQLPGMSEFWKEQNQEIEGRLADAGWQLNLHPQDLEKICGGQLAVAWIDRSSVVRKPYAIGVVIDTVGHDNDASDLLTRIESELKQNKGTVEKVQHNGLQITKCTAPRKAGEVVVKESFFARVDKQLFVTDELETMKGMLDAAKATGEGRLSKSDLYVEVAQKLKPKGLAPDLDYFVRPIGFAKVMRSISKKTVSRQTDMLKVLENQGFDKIRAVRGQVQLGSSSYDFLHDAYVLASNPLPSSVQVLDFPNQSVQKIPEWASSDTASLMSICWNVKDAFWKVEGIVDEVAGGECFKDVIDGIRDDPTGPLVDVRNEVLPYLTSEIYSLTDCVQPISPDSKRSLIAIRVTDAAKMENILKRFMKIEHAAKAFDFEGTPIWVVSHQDTESVKVEGGFDDFGGDDFKKDKSGQEDDEEQPWLNRWAITVYKDFILFSSHPEYITETIKTFKNPNINGQLQTETEIARALAAIQSLSGGDPNSVWQINRASKSFQMQYELFRQDKLPQSRSMMASLMDRLLRPKTETKNATQKVKGDRLPEFKEIQKYLMPSGTIVKTEEGGWAIQSFILGLDATSNPTTNSTSARTAERSDESIAGQQTSVGGTIR